MVEAGMRPTVLAIRRYVGRATRARLSRKLFVLGLVLSICIFATKWYALRELLVMWLLFCVLFGVVLVVLALAFVVGEAVETVAIQVATTIRSCYHHIPLPSVRNWLGTLAPANSLKGKNALDPHEVRYGAN